MLHARKLESEQQIVLRNFFKSNEANQLDAIDATVRRDFAEAVAIYRALAKGAANSFAEADCLIDLGRALEKNEEMDFAVEAYDRAVALNPQSAAAHLRHNWRASTKTISFARSGFMKKPNNPTIRRSALPFKFQSEAF